MHSCTVAQLRVLLREQAAGEQRLVPGWKQAAAASAVPEHEVTSNGTMHAAPRSSQVTAARAAELANDPLLAQARNELAGDGPLQMHVFAVASMEPSFCFCLVLFLHLSYAVLCHSVLVTEAYVRNPAGNTVLF